MAGGAGDRLAEHLPHIRRVVRRIAGDRGDLDDISQECCVRIIEKEHLWSGREGTLAAWIAAVSRNVAFRYLSRRRKTMPLDEQQIAAPEPSPAGAEISEQQIRWVLGRFAHLPAPQREALHMRYYRGMRTIEIAEILGIAPQSVSERISNGIRTLQREARRGGLPALFLPWWWDWKGIAASATSTGARTAVAACLLVGAGAGGGYTARIWMGRRAPSPDGAVAPVDPIRISDAAVPEADGRVRSLERENERLRQALFATRVEPPLPTDVDWGRVEAALALLKRVAPDEFAGMTAEELARSPYVALFDRVLKDEDLSPLTGLPALKGLNLSGSIVTDENLRQLSGLSLETLLLYDTVGVTDANLARVAFSTLRELRLMNVPITDEGLQAFSGLDRLTGLTLTGTQVTGRGFSALPPGLTHMILAHTPLAPGVSSFLDRFSLKELNLDGTGVGDADLAKLLPALSGLESLSLSRNRLTGEGWLRGLRSLPVLKDLILSGTSLSDSALLDFVPPDSLRRLSLVGSAVSREAAEEFQRRHPGVEVRR